MRTTVTALAAGCLLSMTSTGDAMRALLAPELALERRMKIFASLPQTHRAAVYRDDA